MSTEQFKGWDDATPVSRSPVPLEGIYPEVEIEACIWKESAKNEGKMVFVVELMIHRSMVIDRMPGTPMGVTRTQGDYGIKNLYGQIKTLLGEILGKSAAGVTQEDFASAISSENPLRGKRFGLIATRAKPGKDWCDVRFVNVMTEDYVQKLKEGRVVQALPMHEEPEQEFVG